MGFQGMEVQITGQLRQTNLTDDPENPQPNRDLAHLVTWLQQPKALQTSSPKGRFGLRMDDMPQFNVTPGLEFGYVLAGTQIVRDGEYKRKAGVIITLRFSGNPKKGLGT